MAYPDTRNPREVRAFIENIYARYVSGEDRFPKARLVRSAELLATKTRPVARALESAWRGIDEDRSYFESSLGAVFDSLRNRGPDTKPAIVVTAIGRNVVNVGRIQTHPRPNIQITEFPRREFLETFEGHSFGLANGGAVTLRNGKMEGEFGGVIIRENNASALVGFNEEETQRVMADIAGADSFLD